MSPSWNAIKRVPSRIVRRLAVTHHRAILKKGRPRPEPFMPGRVPSFRSNARPRSFSFSFEKDWKFYDHYSPGTPCLVLWDAHRKPRFVLGFSQMRTRLEIRFVQRVYSDEARKIGARWAKKMGNYDSWDRIREFETKENNDFAQKLGMHPAEFLVSEFIYRNRDRIHGGMEVALVSNAGSPQIYKPLRDRFFQSNVKTDSSGNYPVVLRWTLNPNKKRVKDILAVE